ncbi:hypothetical protein C2845_PM15G26710 [Panicum miliaceum]|uniref:Uncharacterized protein n=1 Tax=Panicum miliaceum TaxID=4540 RepID=A0A3L6Q922_PANMI|nr:hypothetical protein C2845_PM15G26710 [Panicum miliaceum]
MDFIRRLRDCILGALLPPPKAAARDDDFLSLLPDCILGTIVSLLPPKAGARTAVLSRRWRYIWQSVPLDLNIGCSNSDLRSSVTARQILLLLSSRRGPIRSVRAVISGGHAKTLATVSIRPCVPLDELSFNYAPELESIVLCYMDLWHIRAVTQPAAAPSKLRECLNFSSKDDDEEEDEFNCWQQQPDEGETITCLDRILEKVQMDGYSGTKGEVEFARFLMAKAKLLVTMKMFHPVNWSKQDIDSQKNRICISGKASPAAQIYFTKSNNGVLKREIGDYMENVSLI